MIWAQFCTVVTLCCVLGSDVLRDLSLFGDFEQAANSVNKNAKKSTGSLDTLMQVHIC